MEARATNGCDFNDPTVIQVRLEMQCKRIRVMSLECTTRSHLIMSIADVKHWRERNSNSLDGIKENKHNWYVNTLLLEG